jgi:type II secretory pathway predicted ATPase ExeA
MVASQFFCAGGTFLNYQWDSKPLLSLVLIGLPDLEDRLRLRRNRSLHSRLHRRFCIGSLSPDDTHDYLRTRLGRVGRDAHQTSN